MSTIEHAPDFAAALRQWRGLRRISQLELALRAEVSARHVAFLEKGRAKPSRDMVETLAEALDVPLASRNALFDAAGFAPRYKARRGGDPALAAPEAAIAWMLDRHAPYPGFALDRLWRLVRMNAPAARMLAGAGLETGSSLLEAFGQSGALRDRIVNWPAVARYMAARLRAELDHYGPEPTLDRHWRSLAAAAPGPAPEGAVLPIVYAFGDVRLSFISTIAHFGAAEDIALDDLRIELLFPADEPTKAMLLAAEAGPA
jgi:transcriptional regulator with XRE-family HTH domain